jgi:hypothetical protein
MHTDPTDHEGTSSKRHTNNGSAIATDEAHAKQSDPAAVRSTRAMTNSHANRRTTRVLLSEFGTDYRVLESLRCRCSTTKAIGNAFCDRRWNVLPTIDQRAIRSARPLAPLQLHIGRLQPLPTASRTFAPIACIKGTHARCGDRSWPTRSPEADSVSPPRKGAR